MLTKIIQVISPFLIGIISITGDTIIKNSDDIVIRAISDNLTHGLVAGISWLLIIVINQHSIIKNIPSIALCTAMSSFIDVDHFIEARSWRLNVKFSFNKYSNNQMIFRITSKTKQKCIYSNELNFSFVFTGCY